MAATDWLTAPGGPYRAEGGGGGLVAEIKANAERWDATAQARALSDRSILLVGSTPRADQDSLVAALSRAGARRVTGEARLPRRPGWSTGPRLGEVGDGRVDFAGRQGLRTADAVVQGTEVDRLAERAGMEFAILSGDPREGPYTQMRKVQAGTDNPLTPIAAKWRT